MTWLHLLLTFYETLRTGLLSILFHIATIDVPHVPLTNQFLRLFVFLSWRDFGIGRWLSCHRTNSKRQQTYRKCDSDSATPWQWYHSLVYNKYISSSRYSTYENISNISSHSAQVLNLSRAALVCLFWIENRVHISVVRFGPRARLLFRKHHYLCPKSKRSAHPISVCNSIVIFIAETYPTKTHLQISTYTRNNNK